MDNYNNFINSPHIESVGGEELKFKFVWDSGKCITIN